MLPSLQLKLSTKKSQADEICRQPVVFTLLSVLAAKLRAGMMASRLNHREHVIPALTDHLVDEAG